MLQIGFRLCDDARDISHALAQTRDPFFRRREIARDQKIKAVGQALHVNQRIPLPLLQLFGSEDFVIDVLLENSKINVVRASELRSIDGVQLVAKFFLRGEVFGSRLSRVVGQLAIKTMVTELSRLLGIGSQILLDVIVRNSLERVVLRSRE